MLTAQINQTQWLALSPEVRSKLCEVFNIPKSGATYLIGGTNGHLQSTGHSDEDLRAITVEKMENYLGIAAGHGIEYFELLNLTVKKVEDELPPLPLTEQNFEAEYHIWDSWRKTLLDLKSESERQDLVHKLQEVVKEVFPPKNVQPIQPTTPTKANKGTKKRG